MMSFTTNCYNCKSTLSSKTKSCILLLALVTMMVVLQSCHDIADAQVVVNENSTPLTPSGKYVKVDWSCGSTVQELIFPLFTTTNAFYKTPCCQTLTTSAVVQLHSVAPGTTVATQITTYTDTACGAGGSSGAQSSAGTESWALYQNLWVRAEVL
jgi:hypothetical protein